MGAIEWSRESEESLVLAATSGDPTAFDHLVARYRPMAVSVASTIVGVRDLAEDCAQDALIDAFKALPQLDDPSRFGLWLGAIVRNRARKAVKARSSEGLPLDEWLADRLPSLRQPIDVRGTVACAMRDLDPDLRLVAEPYYLHEWSVGEVAAFLALPVTTVKWRLHVTRMRLRPRLEETLENL